MDRAPKRDSIYKLRQEIHVASFRIIYQVIGKKVFVIAVLDSRRDFQDLLEYRLYRSVD